jgi:ATP-binding cassette subfamily F protein uup
MNILMVEEVTKGYSERVLLDKITFAINDGDKIGLIGVNGTGKSTLLKVIAGLESPDSGKIIHAGNIKIEYLMQSPEFEPGTTVLEQVFKGNSPKMKLIREYETALQNANENPDDGQLQKSIIALTQKMDHLDAWLIETEAKTILTKLGITDFKADISKLSGGQRKRVAMASVLISPADLLILDEPTNHIDNETVDWLEKYLKKKKGALLMVTHDRYLLDRVSNRMIELHNGMVYSYQANYSKYLEMKVEREDMMEASERKRQNLIRRELAWVRRGARARTTKQKARLDRFDELTQEKATYEAGNLDMEVGYSRLGKKIIELENIYKSYPTIDLIKDFNYIVLRDDRIGIIGPNGIGKSTLMKIAAGELDPDQGTVSIGETVKIGYFSQENDEMDNSLRVIDYIKEVAEFVTTKSGKITASQMLERFMFPPSVQWTPIHKLSGGEKRRLFLLKILMGSPNVLMLDEPTNDLDIQTLTILESYIDDFPGAVIAVSHDRYFLDRVVSRIFSFEGYGEIRQSEGNYTDYSSTLVDQVQENEGTKVTQKPIRTKEKVLKFSYKEKIEFEKIDGVIAELEEKIELIEKKINEMTSNFEQLHALTLEKEELEKNLNEALDRWTYLNEMNEEIENSKS